METRVDVPLLDQAVTRWYCPNCGYTTVTRGLVVNGMHECAGLHMLMAPLVRAGVKAKVEAAEREDYLNGDQQARGDDGKPYMNVRLTRDDGEDLWVNAGLATAHMRT